MDEPVSKAWKQPVFWLVVAIPVASVVAAGWLIASALRSSGSDDAVAEPVQRTAQIQQADLGPDARASQLGLSAVLRVQPGFVEVLPVTGTYARGTPLRLLLQHPAHAEEDRMLTLQPEENGWRASATLDTGHDWRVQLAPAQGGWRLTARLPKDQQAVRLAPAL